MAKKKKATKKIENRGRPRSTSARKAPALKAAPRPTPKVRPKFQPAPRPDPVKLGTTSKTVPSKPAPPKPKPAPAPEPAWIRVLGHWVREDELAKGCEWYDSGNEGLKQRPITED